MINLVGFYGISTIVGYLMEISLYTYIYIYIYIGLTTTTLPRRLTVILAPESYILKPILFLNLNLKKSS